MPLVTDRNQVLEVYADAADRGWVIPAFGVENQTTVESVLAAAKDHAERLGVRTAPITLALTNLYAHRSQTCNYTRTGDWKIGLRLFLLDLAVLTGPDSPFSSLNVMVHLDHIQHDLDEELLQWDMRQFSSIMFDASTLPFDENMEATARFVDTNKDEILIEGACDEIVDATGEEVSVLTTPERAEEYFRRTGADLIVANLGTEHRASAKDLRYRGDLARQIRDRTGTRLVLHGCSSVSSDQIQSLFEDGICKVNIWTALERDSSPALLADMARNASRVAGPSMAASLAEEGLLGANADLVSRADLGYYTTVYRQGIVFEEMKKIVGDYLNIWYR